MAEGDGVIYNDFKQQLMLEGHQLSTDTIKVALFTSSYTPDIDADTTYAGLSNECTGSGYTAAGEEVTTKAVTIDAANDRAVFDGDDVVWTALGALSPQPAWAVAYNVTSGRLIAYWEVATLTNGGDYTLRFSQSPSAIILVT